jgi:hypothetical protein
MRFEIHERGEFWIVFRDGEELARHNAQCDALHDVANRMRENAPDGASLMVRYASKRDG